MAGEVFFPDHFFGEFGEGASPTAPTLSISVSGTTATGTIAGDTGVTNYLFYMVASDSEWTSAGSRSGDGTIAASGLSVGVRYIFVALSVSSTGISLPSLASEVLIQVSTTSILDGLLADQADIFLSRFGEAVTYYPKGGGSRSIVAIVDRNPVSGIPGSPHGNTRRFLLIVKNAVADGISSSEVNTGGDKVGLSGRIGETAIQSRIMSIPWHDHGMMHLEVA